MMRSADLVKKLSPGLISGLAGTAVIQGLQIAGQKKMPDEMPPIKQHPGEYLVEKAENLLLPGKRERVPRSLEKAVAQVLGTGYGVTFGLLYNLLHRKKSNLLLEGTVLGLAAWGQWVTWAGYRQPS